MLPRNDLIQMDQHMMKAAAKNAWFREDVMTVASALNTKYAWQLERNLLAEQGKIGFADELWLYK